MNTAHASSPFDCLRHGRQRLPLPDVVDCPSCDAKLFRQVMPIIPSTKPLKNILHLLLRKSTFFIGDSTYFRKSHFLRFFVKPHFVRMKPVFAGAHPFEVVRSIVRFIAVDVIYFCLGGGGHPVKGESDKAVDGDVVATVPEGHDEVCRAPITQPLFFYLIGFYPLSGYRPNSSKTTRLIFSFIPRNVLPYFHHNDLRSGISNVNELPTRCSCLTSS